MKYLIGCNARRLVIDSGILSVGDTLHVLDCQKPELVWEVLETTELPVDVYTQFEKIEEPNISSDVTTYTVETNGE